MDKIHDLIAQPKAFGKANANENNNIEASAAWNSLSPPTFQLKTSTSSPETEEKEESSAQQIPYQLAEDGRESPSDAGNPPSGDIPSKPNNTGLPDQLKSGAESLSGFSLDDVNVHYNSSKPAQLQAHAYAQGTDIHLGPGQEKHLPHEAWHVVQQKQGRVQATTQMKGIGVNDDSGLEKEADEMGAKAMQLKSSNSTKKSSVSHSSTNNSVQFKPVKSDDSENFVDDNTPGITLIPNGSSSKSQNPKFKIVVDGVEHNIIWSLRRNRYYNPATKKNYSSLRSLIKNLPSKSLMEIELHKPKAFLLDSESEGDESSSKENQESVFEELDEQFEAAHISEGNKGVLSLVVRMKDSGLDLDIASGIRSAGAMDPFEGVLPDSLKQKMVRLVIDALKGSGQWEYIASNKKSLINDEWSVIIDVDFYYARTKSQTSFHMDTSGETLFTNLIFNAFEDKLRFGPEVISDLSFLPEENMAELDKHVGGSGQFPGEVAEDVVRTRRRPKESEGDKVLSETAPIDPLQIVSFTDPTSLHASPQSSGRYEVSLADEFHYDIGANWEAKVKEIGKGLRLLGINIGSSEKLNYEFISKTIGAAKLKKKRLEAKFLNQKKNIEPIDALIFHFELMKEKVTNTRGVGILKKTINLTLSDEKIERVMDHILEDEMMKEAIHEMKSSEERRTFIRMWVQVVNTSVVDQIAILESMRSSIAELVAEKPDDNPMSYMKMGLKFKVNFAPQWNKISSRISSTLIARPPGETAAIKTKLEALHALLTSYLVDNTAEGQAETGDRADIVEKTVQIRQIIDIF